MNQLISISKTSNPYARAQLHVERLTCNAYETMGQKDGLKKARNKKKKEKEEEERKMEDLV